jgi:phosphatidylinositol 3-kinase
MPRLVQLTIFPYSCLSSWPVGLECLTFCPWGCCACRYRKLAHDKLRGVVDPNLKPNKEERERIESLVASPSDHLRIEDKDLLWTFRFSLTDNKKALTKFLLSVDWSVEQEVEQVPTLLEQWRAKATIDFSDALKLLGR